MQRREFLGTSLAAGFAGLNLTSLSQLQAEEAASQPYRLQRIRPTSFYDGKRCWCHPRAGIVPGAGKEGQPRVVMTLNTMNVAGSDVFEAMYSMQTDDLGQTWTDPVPQENLTVNYRDINGERSPVTIANFWPSWHKKSQTLLGTGSNVAYTPKWKVRHPRPQETEYSIYDPETSTWGPRQILEMPDPKRFVDCGAGCTQRYDLEDGTVLLPVYFRPPGQNSRAMVLRCAFDGKTLTCEELGTVLKREDGTRGLHEPSLTRFNGTFFLTLRNDLRGFVARSEDGLHYDEYQEWTFDDGQPLGNYNTQQNWVTHSDALYLVYTRKGADNDHVFRHRAPLFMAQVDPERLCVIRETEQAIVPDRGARLGNFGVTTVSPEQSWVTTAEWMQTWGPDHALPVDNKYGSDGSIWVAQLHWNRPNQYAKGV